MSKQDYKSIGLIGLINMSFLTLITLWRLIRFLMQNSAIEEIRTYAYKKKVVFYLLILMVTISDIPEYIALYLYGEITSETYSFHKLESAFLFGAYSITIADWGVLLFYLDKYYDSNNNKDIQEFRWQHLMFRRATLLSINIIYILISLINFIICYIMDDLDNYLNSSIYVTALFFQVTVAFLLNCFMLHAGLKLSHRISGAAGDLDNYNVSKICDINSCSCFNLKCCSKKMDLDESNDTDRITVGSNKDSFRTAVWNLNIVMATCSACIFLQMTLLILNYGLGYANSANETVGPIYFWWICYSWIPLWGPILSLLYLSRTHAKHYVGLKAIKSGYKRANSSTSLSNNEYSRFTDSLSNPIIDDSYDSEGNIICFEAYHDSRSSSGDKDMFATPTPSPHHSKSQNPSPYKEPRNIKIFDNKSPSNFNNIYYDNSNNSHVSYINQNENSETHSVVMDRLANGIHYNNTNNDIINILNVSHETSYRAPDAI